MFDVNLRRQFYDADTIHTHSLRSLGVKLSRRASHRRGLCDIDGTAAMNAPGADGALRSTTALTAGRAGALLMVR
jgi:hypothetical protein